MIPWSLNLKQIVTGWKYVNILFKDKKKFISAVIWGQWSGVLLKVACGTGKELAK